MGGPLLVLEAYILKIGDAVAMDDAIERFGVELSVAVAAMRAQVLFRFRYHHTQICDFRSIRYVRLPCYRSLHNPPRLNTEPRTYWHLHYSLQVHIRLTREDYPYPCR
jgi:hypothetical protein